MQSAESICFGRIPCDAVVNFAKTAAALSNRAVISSAALAESATALIKNKNCVTFTIVNAPWPARSIGTGLVEGEFNS